MARTYAKTSVTIWGDDDFMDLSMPAQWLYWHLLSQPKLSHCGVLDWRPRRIVPKSSTLNLETVEAAAEELEEGLYIIVDRDTEEVLVRSYMRNDGLLTQRNMGVAVAKAHAEVSSRTIRGVVVHEVKRLHHENPTWTSWGGLADVLKKASVDPSELVAERPA
ncbi:hypothetical protein [Zhihengliuella halotolerans]|uniref:hypothetical protein n=1 Tax=Zhihengliuella halotolerans TaxID=370736 RepID=UPI000C808C1E|nr:hypothetical protein [Zhihengliuella halotolerans]